jgi:hypothetical protein
MGHPAQLGMTCRPKTDAVGSVRDDGGSEKANTAGLRDRRATEALLAPMPHPQGPNGPKEAPYQGVNHKEHGQPTQLIVSSKDIGTGGKDKHETSPQEHAFVENKG